MAIQKVSTSLIEGDAITEASIADDAVESEHLNDNVISGQTEITSGLVDADELLYSDGGTIKKVGLDTLQDYILTGDLTGSTVTLDSSGDVILDADGGDVFFKDDGTTFGSATNSSGELILKSGTTTNLTMSGANITSAGVVTASGFTIGSAAILEAELETIDGVTAGTVAASKAIVVDSNKDIGTFRNLTIDGVFTDGNYTFDTSGNVSGLGTIGSDAITSTGVVTGTGFTIGSAAIDETELEILDGATVTTAELNIIDGDTTATSTTLVDADRFVVNDNGTMVQVAASDLKTYVNASEMGTQHMWIPSAAMRPTSSNGCDSITDVETTSGRPDMQVLDFDASSDEHAQFQVAMPSSWNEGTITYQAYWTTTASDTDGVAWALQGVAIADNDTMDVAYGTAIVVTDDALGAAEDLMVTAASSAVTIAGSPAAGELCAFRIFRDISDGNDDMTEDARLIGVKIIYTTNAATD